MTAYQWSVSLALTAASANNVALSQSASGAGNLTLNGSLVSGGVATFDVPRRVLITAAGNDSGINYTVTGTDRYGRPQSEVVKGPNATTGATLHDFSTVSQVSVSGATASTVTIGTNTVGSTQPWIIDAFANPVNIGIAGIITSGAATFTVEQSYDDFSPAWDLNANTPTWFASTGFSAVTSNTDGNITGPITMMRLTINSGTGTVNIKAIQALKAGGF